MVKEAHEVRTDLVPAGPAPTAMVHGGAGTLALALMGEDEFSQRLAALKKGQERIKTIKRELMQEDAHYGTVPGTDKPCLLKPGAEVLCSIYGLRPDFIPHVEYGDGLSAPAIRVHVRCELHLGDLNGPVVAIGLGASNSWERKHRWRRGERTCPQCGAVGGIRRSSFPNKKGPHEGGKGWWCRDCRTNWDDPQEASILEQETGDVENPDQHDLENTLVKMAKKRAHVDAALTGTASSDLFTQDVDEDPPQAPPPPQQRASSPPVPAAGEAPQTQQREPGDDEGDFPDRGEEAYAEHQVEPPAPAAQPRGGAMPACPQCKSTRSVIHSKFKQGQLVCYKAKGGCGHQWPEPRS